MLNLSPMMVAPVCHVGDPLLLTCTATIASIDYLEWNFTVVNEYGRVEKIIAHSNSIDPTRQLQAQRTINSTTFTFMRTSARWVTPLVSTLSIDSVNIGLNGTVVRCLDLTNFARLASTTIYVIDTSESATELHKSP